MTNTHGGAGRGQGRKPLDPSAKTVKRNVTLLPSQVEAMEKLGNGNLSSGIRKAINMNTIANSASSICNYCGAIYNAYHGNHICNVDDLETLIDQERSMTDEPDERTIDKLETRIVEVRKFWSENPNHKTELSHHITS